MSWNKGGWQGGEGPWGKTPGSGGGPTPPPEKNPKKPDFDSVLRRGREQFKGLFDGGGDNPKLIAIGILAVVLLWLSSGVYIVESEEQGVVTRFGEFHRITEPGLNYHMPYPIETVATPKVTSINRVEIGGGAAREGFEGIGSESLMLTGDENIVDISFEVQWRISNPQNYLFSIRSPEQSVRAVAESAMREVVGRSPLAAALINDRLRLAREAQTLMQEMFDHYEAGIEIITVNLTHANPPGQVIDAFHDVQAARADQEKSQNEAESYRNKEIPKARGEAEKRIQEAEAYRQEVVALAKGDASRFLAVYKQFTLAKDVTRRRLYIETMEDILKGMNKVIVDGKAGSGVLPYMALPNLKPQESEEKGR